MTVKAPACRSCGKQITPVVEPVIVCGRPFAIGPTVCTACAEATETEKRTIELSRWQRMCPALYTHTEIGRLQDDLLHQGYDSRWMDEVLAWQYGSRGIVISGPTGVGKSRLMWLLLRRLLDVENRTAVFLNAVRFRTGVQAAGRDGTSEEFVRRLVRTNVLYWDDLGQMHLTGAASEMLLHLLEERICAGRPILATTQYSGKGMDAQFERPEMGQAIRRRLNEFCRVVTVREAGERHGAPLLQSTGRR